MQLIFEELISRASKFLFGSNDYELLRILSEQADFDSSQQRGIIYNGINEKTLKASARDPFSSEEASILIQKIHGLAAQSDLIHQFSALKPMP